MLKAAILIVDNETEVLGIGTQDQCFRKILKWYVATLATQSAEDVAHAPDPATATLGDIAYWYGEADGSYGVDIVNVDPQALTYEDDYPINPDDMDSLDQGLMWFEGLERDGHPGIDHQAYTTLWRAAVNMQSLLESAYRGLTK